MGCIARLGCLVVLAILAVGAWLTRDHWMSKVAGTAPAVATAPLWEPVTPAAQVRGQRAIESLKSANGPVFALNPRAGEIASYVFQTVGHRLPASADSVEAAVIGDALYVTAIVPMKDLAGSGVLGPLGSLLGDRERITIGGGFRVVRPGLSVFSRCARSSFATSRCRLVRSRGCCSRSPREADWRALPQMRCPYPRPRHLPTCASRITRSRCTRRLRARPHEPPHSGHRRRAGDPRGARRSCSSTRATRYAARRRGAEGLAVYDAVEAAARVPRREDGGHGRDRDAEAAARARSVRRGRDDQRPRDDPERGRGHAARRVRHPREAARHRPHPRHAAQRDGRIDLAEENARPQGDDRIPLRDRGQVVRDPRAHREHRARGRHHRARARSPARTARARSWWRARSTGSRRARESRSSR